tara:strand:- start:4 stop:831 length:828 start_codon:yes stop_codon:yes gene_type:complete
MSSLNKLIEKLAGGDSPAVAESVETASGDQSNTDLVYVEKLASAVDFIIDNMESLSNIGDESDEGTQEPITKEALNRDPDTGRFVSDKEEAVSEVEEPEAEISAPINISEALRDRLQARITAKQEAAQEEVEEDVESSEANKELISNVLGKLRELKSDPKEETKDTDSSEDFYSGSSDYPSEKEIFNIGDTATDEQAEETASDEADGEAAVKAASAGHSLADVLNAALSSDERLDESISVGAETDSVHSSEGPMARKQATDNLKKRLMAKIGKEA